MSINARTTRGFTLIELLVVMGIIAILAAIVILAINPARQFAQARNSQRQSDVHAILDAIGQRMADNKGVFAGAGCADITAGASSSIKNNSGASGDVGPCLVPTYVPSLPFDPTASGAHWTSATDYDTGYEVNKDATTLRITVCVKSANQELGVPICISR